MIFVFATPGAAAGAIMALRDRGFAKTIVGNDVPDDPGLRPVFPDPAAAGEAFRRRHGFVPVNHMLVVRRDLAGRPGIVAELLRLF